MKKTRIHSKRKATTGNDQDISERIIASAIKLFGRTSHYYVSLREISRDADVTLSLTIYHFKSKEILYRIAFERSMTPLDDYFRKLGDHLDHHPKLNKKGAIELLLDCVGTTFNIIYDNNTWGSHGKMLLYELAYPTLFHEEFQNKYFAYHFDTVAKLIMRIDRTTSYDSAFRQGVTILGEIFSFMVQRELIAKTLRISEIGPKEIERFRKMILEHSMHMIANAK